MNIKDIYRTFYPTSAEYTFSLSTHRTFARILYIKQQNKSKHIQGDGNYIKYLF